MLRRSLVMKGLDIRDGVHPAAVEVALQIADDGAAVAHMILRRDDIAVLIQKAREMVVAADVLGNAVDELDDGLRLRLRKPLAAVQLTAAGRGNIKDLHFCEAPF